jgi:uncharacterized protein (TIGR00290 family)
MRMRVMKGERSGREEGASGSGAVVSGTGGKDGCLAAYKAMEAGVKVRYLLSFWNQNREGAHEVSPALLAAQADSLGMPLIRTGFSSYEEEFKRVFRRLDGADRKRGAKISSAVFGHIRTHGPLVDRICASLAIEVVMPIWNMNSEEVIGELLEAGFEAVVVGVKADLLGDEWLGRRIDEEFVPALRALDPSIDPCGENGEFHTFVLDGPIFKKRLVIEEGEAITRGAVRFLDIKEFAVEEKGAL